MNSFIHDDFLLDTESSRILFHSHVKNLPIIDFHNHISAEWINENHKFNSITELWLNGDHYKWRAMRILGVDEHFITGNATDWEKFKVWAEVCPKTIRNPLYHWTHLELKRFFDIDLLLNEKTAATIYEQINEKLSSDEYSARSFLKKSNVERICTTDMPNSKLDSHRAFSTKKESFTMHPTLRVDALLGFNKGADFLNTLKTLENTTSISIIDWSSYKNVIESIHSYFHENDCRLSDVGIEDLVFSTINDSFVDFVFKKVLRGKLVTNDEQNLLKTAVLREIGRLNSEKGWVQQLHLGALRNSNSKMFSKLGSDSGFDTIGDGLKISEVVRMLDFMDKEGNLPKSILYNLNPSDNSAMAAMTGLFSKSGVKGKIQWGAAWWFLDQYSGIKEHLNTLSGLGIMSSFVGMITDSRSLMSFTRHEYFRRILCSIVGKEIQQGLLPTDYDSIGEILTAICYTNAKHYFNFDS